MQLSAGDVTLRGDHLVRATAREGRVRLLALRAETALSTITQKLDLSPIAAAAAGRLWMGSQFLAADLKQPEASISVVIKGDGPLGGLTAVCDAQGNARVSVNNPHVETREHRPGKLAVGPAVGQGQLTVIRDLGRGEPYIGRVPLLTGEIAEDLAAYWLQSEQIPTVLSLGVAMTAAGITFAGGLLVQLMPDATDEDLNWIEQRAQGGFPEVTFLLQEGFSPAQIMDLFMGDPDLTYLSVEPIQFSCPCSEQRMARNLVALGAKTLTELAEDPEGIELTCHFCQTHYRFTPNQLAELLQKGQHQA